MVRGHLVSMCSLQHSPLIGRGYPLGYPLIVLEDRAMSFGSASMRSAAKILTRGAADQNFSQTLLFGPVWAVSTTYRGSRYGSQIQTS